MSAAKKGNPNFFNSTIKLVKGLGRGIACRGQDIRIQVSDSTGVYVVETAPVCACCAPIAILQLLNMKRVHTVTITKEE